MTPDIQAKIEEALRAGCNDDQVYAYAGLTRSEGDAAYAELTRDDPDWVNDLRHQGAHLMPAKLRVNMMKRIERDSEPYTDDKGIVHEVGDYSLRIAERIIPEYRAKQDVTSGGEKISVEVVRYAEPEQG